MPAHNAAGTIKESIDSVVSQTFVDWELLVINDNSTDKTEMIVSGYAKKDARIKLLHTDKSIGKPFYPRNLGIKAAVGRIIAFLDSDDVWLPTKLDHQLSLFENEDTAIAFSYYEKFSSGQTNTNKNRIIKSPETITFNSALYGNPIGNLTGMYDTQKVGKVFYEDAGHEDYILWLSILKKGFVAKNSNTVEARYRVAEKSVSSNKGKAAAWTWNIYRKTLKFNVIKSAFCYSIYMVKGVLKYLK